MTKQLSPAAQAVMNACTDAPIHINWATRFTAAAVLRAVVDQVVPEEDSYEGGFSDSLEHQCRASERRLARAELLAIADELEAQ
jgi:hypothetical protein